MSLNFPALVQLLTDRLPTVMSPARVQHVLGVTHVAATLAGRHGLDPERAALAGLLHDQFKEVEPDRLRRELEALGERIAPDDLDFPKVWHGARAAAYARHELGIAAADLLESVALHSTSDAAATPLTHLVFIADYAEPGRKRAEAAEILRVAREDLAAGYRLALRTKIGYLLRRGRAALHPRALRALEEAFGPGELDQLAREAASEPENGQRKPSSEKTFELSH